MVCVEVSKWIIRQEYEKSIGMQHKLDNIKSWIMGVFPVILVTILDSIIEQSH